jgi:hypothetical protein
MDISARANSNPANTTTKTNKTNKTMKTLLSIGLYLKSKLVSLIVLAVAILLYGLIPSGTPFVETAYAAVVVLATIILAPVLRLLVFNEAALYAEGGQLMRDLSMREFTPALVHYWIATIICYASPILILALSPK